MQRALNMSFAERSERHRAQPARVWARDAKRWREEFLGALTRIGQCQAA